MDTARPGSAVWLEGRTLGGPRSLLCLGLALALHWAPQALHARPQDDAALLLALRSPDPRVRLNAATLAGKRRLAEARDPLREVLRNRHPSLQAAAAVALARIGDQASRAQIVPLLGLRTRYAARAGESALILLDRALGRPRVLVAMAEPSLPEGVPPELGERLLAAMQARLRAARGVVLSAGEEKALKGAALDRHLKKRRLRGVYLMPNLQSLDLKVEGEQTTVTARVSAVCSTLVRRKLEFVGTARASVRASSPQLSGQRGHRMSIQVVEGCARAAAEEILDQLMMDGDIR